MLDAAGRMVGAKRGTHLRKPLLRGVGAGPYASAVDIGGCEGEHGAGVAQVGSAAVPGACPRRIPRPPSPLLQHQPQRRHRIPPPALRGHCVPAARLPLVPRRAAARVAHEGCALGGSGMGLRRRLAQVRERRDATALIPQGHAPSGPPQRVGSGNARQRGPLPAPAPRVAAGCRGGSEPPPHRRPRRDGASAPPPLRGAQPARVPQHHHWWRGQRDRRRPQTRPRAAAPPPQAGAPSRRPRAGGGSRGRTLLRDGPPLQPDQGREGEQLCAVCRPCLQRAPRTLRYHSMAVATLASTPTPLS